MFSNFSSEAAASPSLFQALGLDGKLLIEQALAFLILVAILQKFVYPVLIKSIEDRRRAIEAGAEDARKAAELLASTETKVDGMLKSARQEADGIIARSHQEAAGMVAEAEEKARVRGEAIIRDAQTQLQADVARARKALKRDTISLVALATERIIEEKIDIRKDAELIERSLERAA